MSKDVFQAVPPVRPLGLALLILLLTWLIFFSRTIFLQQVYFLDDLKIIFYPLEHAYGEFQRALALPVWSPLFGFGQPLLAWGQLGFFTPVHVVLRLLHLHPLILLQASILIYFALGLIGMFWFLRRRALHPYAAALGAIVFVFSGFHVGHLNHVNFYVATMVLPYLLVAIDALVVKPTLQRAATLAVVAAIVPLSGQPQISLYTLLAGAMFGLTMTVSHLNQRRQPPQHPMLTPLRQRLRRGTAAKHRVFSRLAALTKLTSLTLLAALLFLGLSSFATLPLREFLPLTERSDALSVAELFEFSYPPRHAITLFLPYFFGNHDHYWGAKNFQELSAYVGIIPLLLAGTALTSWRSHGAERLTAAVLVLLGAMLALGTHSPLYRYAVEQRWLTALTVPARFIFFFDTGLALLAALGLHRITLAAASHHRRQTIVALSLLAASAATLLYQGWHYNPLTPAKVALNPSPFQPLLQQYAAKHGIPPRLYAAESLPLSGTAGLKVKATEVISPRFSIFQPIELPADANCLTFPAQREGERVGSITVALREQPDSPPLLETTIETAAISTVHDQRLCLPSTVSLPPNHQLFFTATSDHVSHIKLMYRLEPAPSVYFVRVPNPSPAQIARSQKSGRLELFIERTVTIDEDVAILMRHTQVTAGASAARWVGALSIAPYRAFINDLFANDGDPFNGEGVHALVNNRAILNMSGITHLIQATPLETASDGPLEMGYNLVHEAQMNSKKARLYHNPAALPRAWLVKNALTEADATAIRQHISQSGSAPDKLIYVDGPRPPADLPALDFTPLTGRARITLYEPARVDIAVNAPEPAWLVLTDSYTPEWHTYIDGEPRRPLTANSVWRTAFVPAGEHSVSFRYYSPAIALAKKLTLISLLATLGCLIAAHKVIPTDINDCRRAGKTHDAGKTPDVLASTSGVVEASGVEEARRK
ncbi:MAG: hypothetical protein HY372_02205 [Candidatus Andersenbacteria bacterium]|nr:hypothetical protein [Candidatus Andersenbacteria bacterium]